MVLRQKANLTYLSEFKIGCKVEETTCNINNAFGPGTTNEQCSTVVVQEVLQRI